MSQFFMRTSIPLLQEKGKMCNVTHFLEIEMEIIACCSFKGGTAKTSSALHLGACLAEFHNQRVLLIDFDAQANLSTGMGLGTDQIDTMVPVLKGEKRIEEVIVSSEIEGLDVIPANVYLDGVESTSPIVGDLYGHERLRKRISHLDYDYVFIDTPPSLGWLTQSALFAAKHSIICAIPEPFSIMALNRLKEYHENIRENHDLELLGVVLTFWDERGATNKAYIEAIDGAFPGKVFEAKIRRDINVSRSVLRGKPVTQVNPSSRASLDYRALATEFLGRLEGVHV